MNTPIEIPQAINKMALNLDTLLQDPVGHSTLFSLEMAYRMGHEAGYKEARNQIHMALDKTLDQWLEAPF